MKATAPSAIWCAAEMVKRIAATVAEWPTEKDVVEILRLPDARLVDFLIVFGNLDHREASAIDLCGRKAFTQEEAAEEIDRSPDAVQRWYRSGIRKLRTAWAGIWWLRKITT